MMRAIDAVVNVQDVDVPFDFALLAVAAVAVTAVDDAIQLNSI